MTTAAALAQPQPEYQPGPAPLRPADLSVIVVTYNSRDLTLACVRSVLADCARTRWDIELIVVDNASTDGTGEALAGEALAGDALAGDAPPGKATLRVLRSERNLGFAGGNNLGLAAATGRCLFLLNSDTELYPGALDTLIAFLDAHPEAGACGPQLRNPDGSLQPSGRDLPSLGSVFLDMTRLHRLVRHNLYSQRGRDYNAVAVVGELAAAALVVRRSVYTRLGGLDPAFFAYYEDVDWCKRMGDAGYLVYYVPTAQVLHHWGGTSRTVSRLAYAAGQDSLRIYFRKHHGPVQAAAVQAMLVGKEALLWLAAALRGQGEARAFHAAMLRRALRPLAAGPQVPGSQVPGSQVPGSPAVSP